MSSKLHKQPDIHRKSLHALAAWISNTRQYVPMLDNSADALLNQLACFNQQYQQISELAQQPRTLGLYGHCQQGKASLISAFTGNDTGHIAVAPGGKHLNYLSHINPTHVSSKLAIRFSSQAASPRQEWPLTLRLFSEAELVQLFIWHSSQLQKPVLPPRRLQQRIEQLRPLCQAQQQPVISAAEVATLLQLWSQLHQQTIAADCQQQLIQLLPQLNLEERLELYALLWDEQRELSQQWLCLAQTLQAVGHCQTIAAPLSLIVDTFSLPAEGLLVGGEFSSTHLLVCPLQGENCLPAVNIDASALCCLACELTLPLVSGSILPGVDILDIPATCQGNALEQSKITFLLDYYRQQQQPDLLLICNASDNISHTYPVARRLLRWQQYTQPSAHSSAFSPLQHHQPAKVPTPPAAKPGLIWVITPYDLRFSATLNPDESIQRLLGKPGELWGTFQAMETRNLQRITEWLADALSERQRQCRQQALLQCLCGAIGRHFAPLTTPVKTADSQALAQQAIRQLQQHADCHGAVLQALLPDISQLQNLNQTSQQPASRLATSLFQPHIDLLADDDEHDVTASPAASDMANAAFRYWINHVRQWTQQAQQAAQLQLSPEVLHWLGDTLITTSYRLNLAARLQQISQHNQQPAAALQAEIGNFLSWLGYASVPAGQRPVSRINKGARLFQPAAQSIMTPDGRLSRLPEQPAHAATVYVYDWLIALYTRAQENICYHHPQGLKSTDRASLKKLLKKIAPAETADD